MHLREEGAARERSRAKRPEVVGFALSFMVMIMMRSMTHVDFFRVILPVQSMLPTDRKALLQVLAQSPLQSAFHGICLPLWYGNSHCVLCCTGLQTLYHCNV